MLSEIEASRKIQEHQQAAAAARRDDATTWPRRGPSPTPPAGRPAALVAKRALQLAHMRPEVVTRAARHCNAQERTLAMELYSQ